MPQNVPPRRSGEQWRTVPGFPDYMVSNHGRVWSRPRRTRRAFGPVGGKLLKLREQRGYRLVGLRRNRRSFEFVVSRLVAMAFLGPPKAGQVCRHKDGDPANNHVRNLEWGTQRQNIADMYRHGTRVRGERAPTAELSVDQVEEIRRRYAAGGISQARLADEYSVSKSTVGFLLSGRTWKDTGRGARYRPPRYPRQRRPRPNPALNEAPATERGEEWRDIVGAPAYMVSNLGRVWSKPRVVRAGPGRRTLNGRLLKLRLSPTGYPRVGLTVDGVSIGKTVHALVLQTFVGPRPVGMECRHLDGNPANSRLDNLAWGTPEENRADIERHGHRQRGVEHPGARLTDTQVNEIRQRYAAGGVLQRELAAEYGVSASHVYSIINSKTWQHISAISEPARGARKGAEHYHARLNASIVRSIRRRYAKGDVTHKQLAAECGLTPSAIQAIVTRRTWKHVDPDVPVKRYPRKRALGANSANAKLTDDAVREIRRRYAAGDVRQCDLAAEFGVGQSALSAIIQRKTWRHVG